MIVQVPSDLAVDMWPVLAPLFKRVTDTTDGCFEPSDILRDILNGEQTLWVAWDENKGIVDAAMTTCITDFPRRRVCKVIYVSGARMRRWLPEFIETIERYAKDKGATALVGAYRKGWARVWPGLRITGVNTFKDLVK